AIAECSDPATIKLMGNKPAGKFPEPIPSCSFFLMTSSAEGMAVSVVEAMQLGLIPIVTPVGEIPRYCAGGENAILVHDDGEAVAEIISLLERPDKLASMRESARGFWESQV